MHVTCEPKVWSGDVPMATSELDLVFSSLIGVSSVGFVVVFDGVVMYELGGFRADCGLFYLIDAS